ncbi:MAG TPA: hypothetical protein DCW33_00030 [Proteobacteria bacterium]|nr:hypothetical protein [Pseudomonadota bacterium]
MALLPKKGYKKLSDTHIGTDQPNFKDKLGTEIYWFLPTMNEHSYQLSTKQLDDLIRLCWDSFCGIHFDPMDPRFRDYLKASPEDLAWVFESHKVHLQAKKHHALAALAQAIDQSPFTDSVKYKIHTNDDIVISKMDQHQREYLEPYLAEYKHADEMLGSPRPSSLPTIEQFFIFANQQVRRRTEITTKSGSPSATLSNFTTFTERLANKRNNLHAPKQR